MQDLRYEQFFPEFAADEIPVKECVLEQKPESHDEFATEYWVVPAYKARKKHHQEHRTECENVPQLERGRKHFPLHDLFSEESEQEGCRSKIGKSCENRIIALEDAEVSKRYVSEVLRHKIADEKRNPLDQKVDRGNENSDANGTKSA